jgi:hypothetical protein
MRFVEGAYARLRGLKDSTIFEDYAIQMSFGDDYRSVLDSLRKNTDDTFEGFDLPDDCFRRDLNPHKVVRKVLRSKIAQLIQYLELVHLASNRIVAIGSVYNLIKDAELKSRCADLLSATGHFDRVINQATQVLEERVRSMIPEFTGEIGLTLVGKAINPEPSKSRILFSDVSAEQEGYAAIFRGLIGAFRNPTHHRFIHDITREQALQICAFIDNMLSALKLAQVKTT